MYYRAQAGKDSAQSKEGETEDGKKTSAALRRCQCLRYLRRVERWYNHRRLQKSSYRLYTINKTLNKSSEPDRLGSDAISTYSESVRTLEDISINNHGTLRTAMSTGGYYGHHYLRTKTRPSSENISDFTLNARPPSCDVRRATEYRVHSRI